MTYTFIKTDEVQEVDEATRDLIPVHEDHDPDEHVCSGCGSPDADECWAKRHETEVERPDAPQNLTQPGATDCHCMCHQLITQCRYVQSAALADGRPVYRLDDEESGVSMMMPATVHDALMELPEDQRDKSIAKVLAHAKAEQSPAAPQYGSPAALYLLVLLELEERFEQDASFPTDTIQQQLTERAPKPVEEAAIRERLVADGLVEYRDDDDAPRVRLTAGGREHAQQMRGN
jgi:hypothetical protein